MPNRLASSSDERPVAMNRKSIFDAVRRILGRGFSQSEVEALDDALDHIAPRSKPSTNASRVSPRGIDLIKL